jgi:hypothetical protein
VYLKIKESLMTYLSPKDASELAADVCAVNKHLAVNLMAFLSNLLFAKNTTKVMNSEVGFRAINATAKIQRGGQNG